VAPLDTLPRTVQNPAQLLPKHEHPSLIRTNPHLLAWIWKKTEQSLRLRTTKDCIELPRAKTLTLNASALSNPDSLTLFLTSDTLLNMVLKSLVDSGSSDSFIDSVFVKTQHLTAYGILPIKLWLIEGTSNSVISQALDLQIHFPTGESQNLTFYITLLDQSCTIVLGYCWITHYNPSIDWVLGSILFRQP